jgi:hypothetical protein
MKLFLIQFMATLTFAVPSTAKVVQSDPHDQFSRACVVALKPYKGGTNECNCIRQGMQDKRLTTEEWQIVVDLYQKKPKSSAIKKAHPQVGVDNLLDFLTDLTDECFKKPSFRVVPD